MQPDCEKLIKELTLEEKAALCSGITSWQTTPIKRLGIPSIYLSDGPHGVRREKQLSGFGNVFAEAYPATCFPPAVTLASSWNRGLARAVGQALAEECLELKVEVLLGPGVNIKRSPLCGRNFEYMSEDPFLAGEMAVEYIEGVQSEGVGVSLKHFAANSQEFRRMTSSSEIDERALREIYLSAFERAVKRAKPYTVMCSYNRVNGTYAAENKRLLKDILRDEWGFDGMVVSDWGAVTDRVEGIRAGMNLQMPTANGVTDREIVKAVKEGKLDEAVLDERVRELIDVIFKCHRNKQAKKGYKADFEAHRRLARHAAAEGAVLLKNDGILPLDKSANIAVVGELAKKLRSQGSGSSRLSPLKETSFIDYLDEIGADYVYAKGYDCLTDETDDRLINEAAESVKGKDAVVFFLGLTDAFESEAFDRKDLFLPRAQLKVLAEVLRYNLNVAVVLTGGSPSDTSYSDKVRAILNVYLTGEAGGEAVYDLLFGDVNPSGKLAETFPLKVEDNPMYKFFDNEIAEYRESVFVGYRYYETAGKAVAFPFGHGLSYTSFEYSELQTDGNKLSEGEGLKVAFNVTNTGDRAGAEVVQVYVKDTESTIFVPEKQLKGFDKLYLEPGETKRVEIELEPEAFMYYDVGDKAFRAETGEFEILVGASSEDIRLSGKVFVEGKDASPDLRNIAPAYYSLKSLKDYPEADFVAILGREPEKYVEPKRGEYTMLTCCGQMNHGVMAKFVRWAAFRFSVLLLPKNVPYSQIKMTRAGSLEMPVRNTSAMSDGNVTYRASEGLLDLVNGKFFRGIFKLIAGFIRKPVPKRKLYPEWKEET